MGFEKALEFASAVAALKCTKYGGWVAIPSYQDAIDFMEKYYEKM